MRELQLQFVSNPVTVRWLRVLNVIEREQQFTIVNLSKELKVSQRTLISDIGYLKTYFKNSARFTYQKNRYTFVETDRLLYQDKKQALLEPEILFEIIGNIFYGERENIADLSAFYNYSESTLRRFLTMAQKPLSEYGLKLSSNPVNITGSEAAIRKFFFDFYYGGAQTPHTLHPPKDLHSHLVKRIRALSMEQELGSGATVTAFYYLLYITMERSRQGHPITVPQSLWESVSQEKDFQLLLGLQPFIENHYGQLLSEEEFAWIHLQLLSSRTINRLDWEAAFFNHFNRWAELEEISEDFLVFHGINPVERPILAIFIKSFFLTRTINYVLNPVLNKLFMEEKRAIQTSYPKELAKNHYFFEGHREKFVGTDVYFEDIVLSVTLYSQLLFHYYAPKRTLLFLLEGEPLIIQTIHARARQMFGDRHTVNYLKIEELSEKHLNDKTVDLLVTNYSPYLSEYRFTKDYVLMNQIPDRQDWERVLAKVNALAMSPLED